MNTDLLRLRNRYILSNKRKRMYLLIIIVNKKSARARSQLRLPYLLNTSSESFSFFFTHFICIFVYVLSEVDYELGVDRKSATVQCSYKDDNNNCDNN